jgi:peptide/nickel transport system substrate-binding protein
MSPTRQVSAVAMAVAVASGLTACTGGSSDEDPSSGGTLVYFLENPVDTLDPQRLYGGQDVANLGRTVYRSLVAFPASEDPDVATTPIPDLATDTGTPRDGARVWSFTIKDGVTWEDGRPISCEDLRYGASRTFATDVIVSGPHYFLSYLDIPVDEETGLPAYDGPYRRHGQALFDKAVTCEGKTITYRFNRPWPDFPLAIAALHFADPYRQDQDHGNRSRYQILSNGPYRLDGSWGKHLGGTLVRNDHYDASTDSPDLRKALPDEIDFRIGLEPEFQYGRLVPAQMRRGPRTIRGPRAAF